MENPRPSRHHLLFPRQEWDLRPEGEKIRSTPSLIATIRRDDHDYMHEQVPLVPLLGYHTLLALPRNFNATGNTYRDIDGLCSAIETVIRPKRFHEIERNLAGLAIEALMMERSVLKEIRYE